MNIELQEALKELRDKVENSQKLSQLALDKIRGVVQSGHLQSTLTMLKEDLMFRRTLDLLK